MARLADQLLDIALNQIFRSILGGIGGGGGGLIGGLFSEGGYTGPGGKHQAKGVVHGGEYVFSKSATNRIGVGNLESMHKAAKGYAQGGYVLPRIGGASRAMASPAAQPNVDARTTVINRFDAAGVLSEALSQPLGVKVVLNVIRSQPGAFRAAMQG